MRTQIMYDRRLDNLLKRKHVIAGECALFRRLLIKEYTGKVPIYIALDEEAPSNIDFLETYKSTFAEDFSYTSVYKRVENILRPSAERAIVECILNTECFVTPAILEAISCYLSTSSDVKLLYEVAEYFKLPAETLNSWLKEGKNFRR